MGRNVNKHIKEIGTKHFEKLLSSGDFPEIQFERTDFGVKYNLMEYSTTWSRFMKIVDEKLKGIGLEGIWQNARSKSFIDKVTPIIEGVTSTEIKSGGERFKTWCD